MSGSPAVLVDDAAEDPFSPYRGVDRDDHARVVVGWVLIEALMWTVGDEVMLVVTQYPEGMRLVVEQHAIGALGSDAAHEAFRECVRARRARWGLDHVDVFAGEHRVEGPRILGVAVPDKEPERRSSLTQVHHQVASPLGGPGC